MSKFLMVIVIFFLYALIVLGIWWLIWTLWSFLMPQIWPTGPEVLIKPGYWTFAALWVFLGLVGKLIFGHSDK